MIVVLGADGLLGSWICARHPRETIGYTHEELDVTNPYDLHDAILDTEPDAVINCTGITKHNSKPLDEMISVNTQAPYRIARLCDLVGAKLVHVSTDCVFSGTKGSYTEFDASDAEGSYGQTKFNGEVKYSPHLTVRTSLIGYPDPKGRGLLAWLASQQGQTVEGWTRAYWNGLCVHTLADLLVELAYGRSHGIMHLFGETVSKYYLLVVAASILQFDVEIESTAFPVIDRTLSSVRKDRPEVKSLLVEQIGEMREWESKYREYQLSCQSDRKKPI